MVEVLSGNWAEFRECFNRLTEEEKNVMLEHFEALDENYCDVLFGEDSNAEDVSRYVLSRSDNAQEKFCEAMDEALD